MSAGDWKKMIIDVQEGDIHSVKYYIESGIKPNYQHPEVLTTPLIESISFQHFEIAKYLLEQGADPTLRAGFSSDSPIIVAKRTKNKALIQLIQHYLPKKESFFQRLKDRISRFF